MIETFDYEYWHIKVLYDLLGYMVAVLATWFFYKKIFRKDELPNPFPH
jgi:hypothetical protein